MKSKKFFCSILAAISLLLCFSTTAWAVQDTNQITEQSMDIARASGTFNVRIKANSTVYAGTSFPMDEGETVTIRATYTPSSASIDIGLVGPDNIFHYFNRRTGSIDKTIKIEKSGNYTLQIRNNSSSEVNLSGTVRY